MRMKSRHVLAVLAAIAMLAPLAAAGEAVIDKPGTQPDGILLQVQDDATKNGNITAKNFGVEKAPSEGTIERDTRPEFNTTIQLHHNGTTGAQGITVTNMTYEFPDKDVLNSATVTDTWVTNSTGPDQAPLKVVDHDGDSYESFNWTSDNIEKTIAEGSKVNVTVHFQMPKLSTSYDKTVELNNPEGNREKWKVSSSEFHDYTSAETEITAHNNEDFEDTTGGVTWTQEGNQRSGIDVDVSGGTVTHTETVSNQSETVKLKYNLPGEDDDEAAPRGPPSVQLPSVAGLSDTAASILNNLFGGILSAIGL